MYYGDETNYSDVTTSIAAWRLSLSPTWFSTGLTQTLFFASWDLTLPLSLIPPSIDV